MSQLHDIAHQSINTRLAALEGGPPATAPITVINKPLFVVAGSALKQDVPTTRVAGVYSSGTVTSRYRTRGTGIETQVSGGTGVDYTPVAADVGFMMTYYEVVTNSVTGEVKTVASDPVGPILAPDPTTPGEVEELDFTSGTSHTVTVARTGSLAVLATHRTGASSVATVTANTKRYESDGSGQLGLLCEKASNNHFTNGEDVSAIVTATANATKTQNYGTAPDGTTSSTRVQASAGGASRGIAVGASGIEAAVRQMLWVKGTAGTEFVISDPDSGEYVYRTITSSGVWELIEEQGTSAPPSNFLNWRLFNSGTSALDIEVWGVALQEGSGYQTMLLSVDSGVVHERPKEVWTVTLAAGSATRDIQIEDHTGQLQNFLSQVIDASKEWELDADDITIGPVIAKMRVYTEGELSGSPPAGPPPAPPPVSGDYPTMSLSALVNSMQVADDGLSGGGLPPARQAAIQTPINYLGCKYLSEYPRQDGLGNSNFYQLWHALAFWLWIFRSSTWSATGKRIQYRRMTPFILLDDANGDWHTGTVHENVGGVGQSVLWEGNQDRRTPQSLWDMQRAESSGGRSVLLTGNFGVEMWANPGFYAIADQSIMQRAFAGAGCVEVRVINDDGTPYYGTDAKPLVALGGDHYCTSNPNPSVSPGLPQGADGFKGRWRAVDCSDDATEGWQTVGFVTVDFCFKKDGPRPPWGNYNGSWDITSSVYNLTLAQLTANPPPFVV